MSEDPEITITENPKAEPMEVHHHPHLDPHTQWITYLFEFIMIFFAVTAGFMAESYRERLKDKEQIHKYMESMVTDLNSDIIMYDSTMKENATSRELADKLIPLLKGKSKNTSEIYYLARRLTVVTDLYYPNTKTFDQLKSSGGLRLIDKENILDSITSYYQSLKWYDAEGAILDGQLEHIFISNERLFDGAVFQKMIKTLKGGFYSSDFEKPQDNPPLLSADPIVINSVIMSCHALYSVTLLMEGQAMESKAQAKRLADLLEIEYKLKTK
jgi:hypothetical protein